MTGDMQYTMVELLDLLDGALHSDAPNAVEVARWSVMIAQRAGSTAIRASALAAVQGQGAVARASSSVWEARGWVGEGEIGGARHPPRRRRRRQDGV